MNIKVFTTKSTPWFTMSLCSLTVPVRMTLSDFHIIVEEFWLALLYNAASAHWRVEVICLCAALLRLHHSMLNFGPLQHLNSFFFSHSVADLPLCLGSSSFCITRFGRKLYSWPHVWILWYTEVMVDSLTARYPGPATAKEAQIVTPPPPCWRFIGGICADMNMALCITSSLWSHLFKRHYYRSLVVCSHVTILFLERKGFLLATLTVVSGSLIFNILTEAL